MSLYQLTDDYSLLFNSYDAIAESEDFTDEEKEEQLAAWFDTLDGIEQEIESKLENMAVYIKNTEAEIDALAKEEKLMHQRRQAKEKSVERLKAYMLLAMDTVNLNKVESSRAVIKRNAGRESLNVQNEAVLIEWLQRSDLDDMLSFPAPKPDKKKIADYIRDGHEAVGAEIVRKASVSVK